MLVPPKPHVRIRGRGLASPSHDKLQYSSPTRDCIRLQSSSAALDQAPTSCESAVCMSEAIDSRSSQDTLPETKMLMHMLTRMLRTTDPKAVLLAMATPESEDSSRQCHMPKCPPGGRHMLRSAKAYLVIKIMICLKYSRRPANNSGAMYGSLPHSPVDICTVVSQGSR